MTIYLLDGFTLEKTQNSFNKRVGFVDLGRYPESTNIPIALTDQEGRLGGKAFRTLVNLNFYAITQAIVNGTYQVGFGFRIGTITGDLSRALLVVRNETDDIALQLDILADTGITGFRLRVIRHVNSGEDITIIEMVDLLDIDTWFYIELKSELTATSSATIFKINGDTVIDAPSIAGDYISGHQESRFRLRPVQFGATYVDMDDLYISDGTEGFFGPSIQIANAVPNKDTGSNTFTPTPSTSFHFQHVDDAATGAVDYDNTYLDGINVGDQEIFDTTKIANAQGRVHAVRVAMDAQAVTAAGPIVPLLITSQTNLLTEQIVVTSEYIHYGEIRQLDPATSKPWNVDQINDLQIGLEIPAGTLGGTLGMDILEADGIGIGTLELDVNDKLPIRLPTNPIDGLIEGVVAQKLPILTPAGGPGFIDLKLI